MAAATITEEKEGDHVFIFQGELFLFAHNAS